MKASEADPSVAGQRNPKLGGDASLGAGEVVRMPRSVLYYQRHPRHDRAERARIGEIAETRVRYGIWRIHTVLRREGWLINHKNTLRIQHEAELNSRRSRPRQRVAAAHRMEHLAVGSSNECWSMNFVADSLLNGHCIPALTVVDHFTRKCVAITVNHRLYGGDDGVRAKHP